MRLCVGNLKGGAGKTATAVHFALGLSRLGRTLLVDCDPEQPMAVEWSELAGDEWPHERCTVLPVATRDLTKRVAPMLKDYEHVVFDTGAKNRELLRQAMNLSDDVVIPARPTSADLPELSKVFDIAADVDAMRDEDHPLTAVVLLTQVQSNDGGVSEEEAREFLRRADLPVLATRIRMLKRYANARGTAPVDDLGDYELALKELTA